MKLKRIILSLFLFTLIACGNKKWDYDASGIFETEETIISAEVAGVIERLDIDEGQVLKANQELGYIDTIPLYLRKKQFEAQVKATLSQRPDVAAQLAALHSQLETVQKEEQRFIKLVKSDAATQKQLDDVSAQVQVLKRQLSALQSSLTITTVSLNEQTIPLTVQIEQIDDQLRRSHIVNPISGTVLTKFAEEKEIVSPGKALYKIADLSTMILRAYVNGDQLTKLKRGQLVTVLADSANIYKSMEGIITYISDKAEFTPKTIQTKDERANLVYAVKVKVKNDGFLKSGMFAEVKF